MTQFSSKGMTERLQTLARDGVDVVVLGAGVNGAGLFRDLAEQGLSCLIVDKGDFGSGTSAAPSRLIHGGLKYLETGEFGLVAQSTLERNLLLKNAPHLVDPLPTIIPVFSWIKGIPAALRTLFGSTTAPRSRGAVLIKIGLALYDFYGARDRVMPRHRLMSKRTALREIPGMTPSIVAAGLYYDARIRSPERLVMELVKDGCAANEAAAACNFTDLESSRDGALTFRRVDGFSFSVKPRLVINAAGPWIDRVNALLGEETRMIGGTKGSHILLKHDLLIKRLKGRMIYFEADDGRICLVFDYLGRALVGSTDIKAADPENIRCEDHEIDYFLESLRSLLPGLEFDRSQIVYTYAGIRPLPASDATNPGLISRDHSSPVLEPTATRPFPVISLVGGKWTTFRGFAEEVADSVLQRLGGGRRRSTRALAIGGGQSFPASDGAREAYCRGLADATGITEARVQRLFERYGTVVEPLLRETGAERDALRLADADDYSAGEIEWICHNEMVEHLSDLVLRRTTLAITGRLTGRDLQQIAELAASALGWDEGCKARELQETRRVLAQDHGLDV